MEIDAAFETVRGGAPEYALFVRDLEGEALIPPVDPHSPNTDMTRKVLDQADEPVTVLDGMARILDEDTNE